MDDNLKKMLAEFEELKGQHVIMCQTDIVRLIAIGDDDFDWCYVCWDGKKARWYSGLCHIIPLKGHIREKDYDEIVRMAKLNDLDSPGLWGREVTPEILEVNRQAKREGETLPGKDSKILTPFCWDIN